MSTSEKEKTPREVIERIRTHNFLLDIGDVPERVKEGAKSLQTQLNNALRLLSEDLYSKKSHFVLELLQNADDNHYGPEVTPQLILQVTPSRLIVINNELGFTVDNVTAICSVGASSKSKQKSGYIGEKGIGFKSVFTVSDRPEIHSNGFDFMFDRSVEDDLLGYVVPHWCEPPSDVQRDCTTIILPAAKNYEFDSSTLVDLDARLLLFLNKLRQLTLVHEGKRVTYQRNDTSDRSTLIATSNVEGGESTSEVMHYVRAEVTYVIDEKHADEKRPGIDRSTVVLAFPVDAAGAAKPDSASNVFAFLPIRQMGFRFSIQADFILSSSREEILTDRPWNQLLRAFVATAFSSAVETFKKSETLALSYLKFVPGEGDVIDPFFRGLRDDIIGKLARKQCLLSDSGDWKQPSELRIASKSFRKLFPSKVAKELFGFDYVDRRTLGGDELLRSLGATPVFTTDVLSVFKIHGGWLKKQSLDWRAKFYAYVADTQEALIEAGLLTCPCLPKSDDTYVVPSDENVFFPLSKARKYGFESELSFVNNELFEEAQSHSEQVVQLFLKMQVRTDEPYDIVNSHILHMHGSDKWMNSEFKALIGHLRYVKDKLKDYLESALTHGQSELQAFQILREGIWIGTKHNVSGDQWHFDTADNIYLSKEYKPLFCIESNLATAMDVKKLVSPDYLSKKSKDIDAETDSWRQFFTCLGILLAPAVDTVGSDWKCSTEMLQLLESTNSTVRKATLECISQHWSNYANHLTYRNQMPRYSTGPFDTSLAVSLRATRAPSKKRTAVALSDSYYPTAELSTLFGDSLPYVDAQLTEEMLDACRVTRKLDAGALVKRLKQLKAESGGTAKQLQGIYRALDERLWESHSTYIKEAFNQEGLIQVKGVHKGWFKPSELSWRSSSPFLDSLYPPLESRYRDFSKFFCDKLGIARELPTWKRVNALVRLDGVTNHDERRSEALQIYGRANRDLGPKFGREVQSPDWIETFQTKAVYINQRGELVANDDYLFANDWPAIARLFEDDEELSFLAISSLEVPRFGRLFDAAQVARLSGSIALTVMNADSGDVDEDLTTRVRRSVHFFARVLYAKRSDEFEEALKERKFISLKKFEVAEVHQVNLLVLLGEYQRETTIDIATSGERVLYRTGARSVKDMLAAELSKFLGASADLADTFARILMANDVNDIEDFLQVRGIDALPADLFQALEMDVGLDVGDDDDDENFAASNADATVDMGEDSSMESATPEDPDAEDVVVPDDVSKEAPSPSPSQTGESRPTSPQPQTGKPMDAPDAPPLAHRPTPIGATPSGSSRTSGAPAGGDNPTPNEDPSNRGNSLGKEKLASEIGANTPEPRNGEGGAATSGVLTQGSGGAFNGGQTGFGPSHPRTYGPQGKRQPKRGTQKQQNTKSGRLLSYAGGPSDLDQENLGDNPEKAAARKATERAAVEHFMSAHAGRWKSLTEMPPNNPGFDIHAIAEDGHEEFIEVKGQSGAWTEVGVALTPTELMAAQQRGNRYWLCIVEFAQDDKRRQLYLLRNPYGLTQQFRFDVGWKSAAENLAPVLLKPESGMYIDMQEIGCGRIMSVRDKGKFFTLHVTLKGGRQVNKLFNPAKMALSKEPTWQE